MTWEKFWPTRQNALRNKRSQIGTSKIVANLDAILADPVSFILHEKEFLIEPIDVVGFMSMIDDYVNLMDLKNIKEITPELLVERYYKCFSKVIPKLTKKDIINMTQQQCGALYQLVMDTITGQVFEEKKKVISKDRELTAPKITKINLPKLIMEVCMDTGWSENHVLQMPAIRFFALKKSHSEIKEERLGIMFYELCDIVAIAGQSSNFHRDLKTHYRGWFIPEDQKIKIANPRAIDPTSEDDARKVADYLSSMVRYMR